MPSYDNNLIARIQQANDIVDVVAEHIALKRKGREMLGLCPFHDDHKPSMNVSPIKQIFKCFACGAGGDVFKFIQMRENLSFPQAIERLAERAGIELPRPTGRKTSDERRTTSDEIDPNQLARLNSWAAKYFQKNLAEKQKGKAARQYLADRKISPESITKFRLGLTLDEPDHLCKTAAKANIPEKLLLAAGLIVPGRTDKFVNRLMFTITDPTGRAIGFGGRTLADEGAKYINSPATALFDKSNALYALDLARHRIVETGTAVVTEGYTDVIMAHQFGLTNVVASLGTSFTTGHARTLRRYARKAVLLFDADTAGIEAANRALQTALAGRIDVSIAVIPGEKDPCDFLLAQGKDALDTLIKNAADVFSFKWDRLTEQLKAGDTLAARKQAVDDYLEALAAGIAAGNLPPIDTGLIVNRVAAVIALDPRDVKNELKKRIARARRAASYDTIHAENRKAAKLDLGHGLAANAQREILEVILNAPTFLKKYDNQITPDTFDVPAYGQIALILTETIKQNSQPTLAEILAHAESTDLANLIVELATVGEQKANFKARLNGALDAVKLAQKQKDKAEIKEITDQKQFIKRVTENTEKQNPHNVGMV